MLKVYCSDCGSPTEYSLNKPKFCTNCGNSFISIAKNTLVKKSRIIPEEADFEDNETEITEVNQVPDIINLEYDLDIRANQTEKIGSIAGSSKQNQLRKNKTFQKTNRKQVLEDFAREGGAIRPLSRVRSRSTKLSKGVKNV